MIETDRLILRDWRDSDRQPFVEMGRDPEVMRHFPSLMTREQSERMIDERLQPHIARHGWGLWAIERKSDSAFIGFTGLVTVDFRCPIEGEVEIGWRLARAAWGEGFASEAAWASLAYGFGALRLDRMVAMTVEAIIGPAESWTGSAWRARPSSTSTIRGCRRAVRFARTSSM